jgi:hypothetical protein
MAEVDVIAAAPKRFDQGGIREFLCLRGGHDARNQDQDGKGLVQPARVLKSL